MDDNTRYANTDQLLLRTIDAVREQHGSCSAGQLAARLRMSRDVVKGRCQSLRERGLVTWTAAHGSLQRVHEGDGGAQRLYDLLVQRAVEEMAAEHVGPVREIDMEQSLVVQWAHNVVAMATAAAWPELVPLGMEDKPEPMPSEQVVAAPAQMSQPVATAEMFRCAPCNREFTKNIALAGHQTSKAHRAVVAAVA